MKSYLVSSKDLERFEEKLFEAVGLRAADAHSVAALLVHADLRNVRSHGVLRTKPYLDKILGGGAKKDSTYEVVHETPNTAVIDAAGGLGALAGEKAVKLAREKAKAHGIGMVSVRNGNHFGMGGYWALKLAGDDMIGFACSTTDLTMGPPNCKMPFMGNNPFSIAFKACDAYPEVCVDMATSGVALGKAKDLDKRGLPIPSGWMLDKDGNDTTDIQKCFMMVPMAGHKGFGIAFAIELFATLLSGGVLSPDVNNQDLTDTPELSSQCFACFDIAAFRDLEQFRKDAGAYIERLHALPMKPDAGKAKYPGEIEYTNKLANLSRGIELPEALADELEELGKQLHVDSRFLKEQTL